MQPEFIIISLNLTILCVGYLFIYPSVAGSNLNKIALNDLIASAIALTIAGSLFWGNDYEFDLLIASVNWFWFTLVTYLLIEIPFVSGYLKRHKVLDNLDL
ncbi:MAG: hypothetical protein ACJAWS_001047 [Oleiphilaceae bacterium]|jgi:hypothetical protein